ncbi:hypothetical protein [Mycobacterium sp. 48b]|uniref:hypothetical protein n=1 Tax=Mycobacterium sp. 48b TaxID=3400426 RepID=UPI003AAE7D45
MNLPILNRKTDKSAAPKPAGSRLAGGYDDHMEQSRLAQRSADKWLIAGVLLMGTNAAGIFGFPLFLWGLKKMRIATKAGLSVRPIMVTLIGYCIILDAGLNTQGWIRVIVNTCGLVFFRRPPFRSGWPGCRPVRVG